MSNLREDMMKLSSLKGGQAVALVATAGCRSVEPLERIGVEPGENGSETDHSSVAVRAEHDVDSGESQQTLPPFRGTSGD